MALTKDIKSLLPHREPFLFVDEILSADEKGSVCTKRFTGDEFFFQGFGPGDMFEMIQYPVSGNRVKK